MSGCSFCFVLYFFFKQKTAYEMRISDWSSDVCSSDLAVADDATSGRVAVGVVALLEPLVHVLDIGEDTRVPVVVERLTVPTLHHQGCGQQIGRASCRERVCR